MAFEDMVIGKTLADGKQTVSEKSSIVWFAGAPEKTFELS
jgi:hypothetical protein